MKETDRRVDNRDEAKCEGTGNAGIELFRYVARRRVERRRGWLLTEYRPKTVATELVVAKVAHKRVQPRSPRFGSPTSNSSICHLSNLSNDPSSNVVYIQTIANKRNPRQIDRPTIDNTE